MIVQFKHETPEKMAKRGRQGAEWLVVRKNATQMVHRIDET
jgi:hypothetical protein